MNTRLPGTTPQFGIGIGNTPPMGFDSCFAAHAMAPADVKECPGSFEYVIDMPGIKSSDIIVQVGDENVLVISGEQKRQKAKEGEKYVKMDRKCGKLMQKFVLPVNSNTDEIKEVCKDGVLTVTVEKLLPKKPRIIQVQAA